MIWELEEEIVSNSESLEKLLKDASLLYLCALAQCVKQMVLKDLTVCDYTVSLFKSSKAEL